MSVDLAGYLPGPGKREFVEHDHRDKRSIARDIGVVVLTGLIVRVVLSLFYAPQTFPDSGTYIDLARHLRSLSLLDYGGERTPGYPLLILASGFDNRVIWLLQSVMGVAVAILTYVIVRSGGASRYAALCVGVMQSLILNLLFFEANILSEAMAAFCVATSIALLAAAIKRSRAVTLVLLGLVAALAALTRPVYIVLGPVLFVVLALGVERRVSSRVLMLFSVAFVVPIACWCAVNKAATGQFSMSTLAGYSLSNHAGGFMELAPDRYATIRDIYLRARALRLAEGKTHSNAAINARVEMLRATGMTPVQLSQELARISLDLFIAHPALYARSVAEAWASFWAVPNYWNLRALRSEFLRNAIDWVWQRAEQPALRGLNAAFLLLSASMLIRLAVARRRPANPELISLAVALTVLATSALQAVVEYGDNPRFGIPTQPLVLCFVVIAGATLWRERQVRRSARAIHASAYR